MSQPWDRDAGLKSCMLFRVTILLCYIRRRQGFHHSVVETFTLLRCYAAWVVWLGTFRNILSVPQSRVQLAEKDANKASTCSRHSSGIVWPLKRRRIGHPEKSITNYQFWLCNIPEERRSRLVFSWVRILSSWLNCLSRKLVSCVRQNLLLPINMSWRQAFKKLYNTRR